MSARILVTGSRDWGSNNGETSAVERGILREAIAESWQELGGHEGNDITLVHGAAPGADSIAAWVWTSHKRGGIEAHPAAWKAHGKAAGPLRNQTMVDAGADLCLAFLRPDSRGTWDCARRALAADIPVRFYTANGRAVVDENAVLTTGRAEVQ